MVIWRHVFRSAHHLPHRRAADDLRAAADACDLPVEEFVHTVLKREAAEAAEALGWNVDIEADLAEMEDDGEGIPAEEVFEWIESLSTGDPLPRPKARKLR